MNVLAGIGAAVCFLSALLCGFFGSDDYIPGWASLFFYLGFLAFVTAGVTLLAVVAP